MFSKCALRAYNANCTRWKFMPKFHLFGQWLFTLEKQKTPTWVSKPKHLDVFLSNGRGLCRENQCHFQNGFIEDRSYTDPDPLPDCLGGEVVVKYNAYIYSVDSHLVIKRKWFLQHNVAQRQALFGQISPASLAPQRVEEKINMHRLCCTVDGLLNSCGSKMLHL